MTFLNIIFRKKKTLKVIYNFFYSRPDTDKKMSEKEQVIRKLICEDKLSIIYDKLPLSYTGYKPYMACGVPLEKKRNLSIT